MKLCLAKISPTIGITPSKYFWQKTEYFFCSQSENDKKLSFSKKILKMLLWTRNSFGNPAESCLPEGQREFPQYPKLIKRYTFSNFFPSKCSSGHLDCSFDNSGENISTKAEFVLLKYFFEQEFPLKMFLWPPRMQYAGPKNFFQCPTMVRNL